MKRTLLLLFFSLFLMSATTDNTMNSNTETTATAEVYTCLSKNAVAYHKHKNCRGLNRCSHEIRKVKESTAKNSGYRKCKICY